MAPDTYHHRPVPQAAKARIEPVGDGFTTDWQLIVTLQRGLSFTEGRHAAVAVFESYGEAMASVDQAHLCECAHCRLCMPRAPESNVVPQQNEALTVETVAG